MCLILMESSYKVFTNETELNGTILSEKEQMQEVIVSKSDNEKIVNCMDVNMSMGPDRVSGRLLKEYPEQFLEPIVALMKTSITTG